MSLIKIKAFSIDSTDSFTFGNANITTTLNGNVANFSGNIAGANANLGNIVVANYFSGNGSLLSSITGANVTGTVSAATTAGTVTTNAQPNITSVGTLTALAVSGTGNIYGANLVSANYFTGTLTTAAQPNITSVGTLTGLTVNGDITSTGNLIVAGTTTYINSTVTDIKDPIIELGSGANGAALSSDDGMDRGSLLHYYTGGATRDGFMGWKNSTAEFTFASNVSTSNNVVTVNTLGKIKAGDANLGNLVTSNYFSGNGSLLTSITGTNVSGNVSFAVQSHYANIANSVAGANVSGNVNNAITSNWANIANSVAGANVSGNVNNAITSNWANIANSVAGANVSGNVGFAVQSHYANIANSVSGTNVSGNVNNAITSNWANIANSVAGSNVSGQVSNALIAGTVYTNAQPNITSVGTLAGVTATGIVDLTGASNVALGPVANVHITGGSSGQYLQTDGSGTLSWATISSGSLTNGTSNVQVLNSGNITLSTAGTANVLVITSTGANIAGTVNATGNITGANANLGNLVLGNYFSGNGSLLTSITGANVTGYVPTANIANTAYAVAGSNVSGNVNNAITSNWANIANSVAGANVTGNVSYAVQSHYANIANSVSGTNVSGQVGNALIAGTVYTNAQPNITSVGTLSSLVVSGTTNLGAIGNITITGGSAGYVLKTDGAGNLTWGSASAGTGNANISGSDTQLFFNDGGSNTLGTSSSLTFTKSTNTLTTANLVVSTIANLGAVTNVKITGGSSGYLLKTDGTGNLSWYNPIYTSVTADDFTGNGVQTSFTLSTTPTDANYTIVSVGGVVQPKTTYTVSGSTLTFSSAPPSTAPVEVTTINTGMSGGGGGGGGAAWTYSAISANTTAVAGYRYIVDTSSANIKVTLPSSGTLGDEVMIIDGTGNASTHEITVGRNGGNIQGLASDMTVTTDRAAFTLVYYNSTQGWILTNV
jgi:hypothetical protein